MPLPVVLAHRLTKRLAQVRKDGVLPWLGPDGKAQVTVEYQNGAPVRVDTVVISAQHTPEVDSAQIEEAVLAHVARLVLPEHLIDRDTRYLINPTGRFVIGGPRGDTGGAFSGKDPTKVDRSAAYAARHVAKNLVAAGIASRLEVQIAYAIGVARPVSVAVETFGTGKLPDVQILAMIEKHFDLRPDAIIERLGLRRPIYAQTAAYGHFGRDDLDLPWERVDMAGMLRENACV